MFSMCSELTPHARIPDTRIPQFMQPCTRTGQNEYKSKINKHWMQNNFCFLCKNQNMQRQEIDFTKLCWKFFLHFYLLQSSWNFVLARADIYHSNLRLSLFTQCCSYISSIHIYCIYDEGNTEKWLFVYSANYLYETKCDGFAGKVSERQFSYERWIGRNAQIFWFFLHKKDS